MRPFIRTASMLLLLTAVLSAAEPDQTFVLTFDRHSVTAEYAGGDARSPTFTSDLGLRMLAGVSGGNAFSIREGEHLHYQVHGNIDHRRGTIAMWLKAENYDPSAVRNSDPEKSHKSYANVLWKNGQQWTQLYLYQYYDSPLIYCYWNNSYSQAAAVKGSGGKGGDGYVLAGAGAAALRQRQWFHLAATWDRDELRIFLNGEPKGRNRMPAEAKMDEDLRPDPLVSYLGIRDRLWKGPNTAEDVNMDTVVDDVRVWSRTLNPAEVRREYLRAVPERAAGEAVPPTIDVQIAGVDDATGDLDRARINLDYRGLPADWQRAISDGLVTAQTVMTGPGGDARNAAWKVGDLQEHRLLEGITKPGSWTYRIDLVRADGSRQSASATKVRPDTGWCNGLGDEDAVPTPWTPMTMDPNGTVGVWNRRYRFGEGPFPVSVIAGDDELLRDPPHLVVETADGIQPIAWQRTGMSRTTSRVSLHGTGTGRDIAIAWETYIDFDGMVRCDWRIDKAPEVHSMRLEWTVDRRFSDYVLDPTLLLAGDGIAEAAPVSSARGNAGIWLTSRTKGFCWAPEHDGNWLYQRGKGKPIRATVGPDGGRCVVEMVRGPRLLPPGIPYHALFIATPSRPLPDRCRTYRLGGFGRFPNGDVSMEHHVGEGLEGVFSMRPGPNFERYMDKIRARPQKVKSIAMYSAAVGLNDLVPEWGWFGEYWSIPGGPCPPFTNRFDGTLCASTTACPVTSYSDYIMDGMRRLFDHPANMHSAVYYDLCGVEPCANPLHGCSFVDMFGTRINRLNTMALRRHLMRTVRYCHARGRDTIFHAHSFYHPMVHGLGDYWLPGEQYTTLIERSGTPYAYSDHISDDVYRSELCQDLKGSGVLFLGSLSRANRSYGTEEQTMAMCTKLLLHDIPISIAFEDGNVINRIWGIGMRYGLDRATFQPYWEQRVLPTGNTQVAASLFQCPDGRILAMVGNLSASAQTAELNVSGLFHNQPPAEIRDEYQEASLEPTGTTLHLELPARLFRIIGFTPRAAR